MVQKLALFGFVFPEPEGVVYFHNPLWQASFRSFWLFGNWLCIGFVLALIGFVLALFSWGLKALSFS